MREYGGRIQIAKVKKQFKKVGEKGVIAPATLFEAPPPPPAKKGKKAKA